MAEKVIFDRAGKKKQRVPGGVLESLAGRSASEHEDQIPGGLADKKKPGDFDQKELAKGIKVEMEHVDDKDLAREIALDHLAEIPDYYDRLETIEKHSSIRVAAPEKYKNINFKPPVSVAKAAEKGLEYRKKASPSNRGGLTTEEAGKEGIGSGVQRAVNLKNRTNMTPETIKMMRGFFARHEKNKGVEPEHRGEPWNDKGHVAWLLWGGDPGKTWVDKIIGQMEAADEKEKQKKQADSDGSYMTTQHLRSLADHAQELLYNINDYTPMPDWAESQVTWAATALTGVYEYKFHGQGRHLASEGGSYMTTQRLREIESHAAALLTRIDDHTQLPDWAESKISQAAYWLINVYEYMGHRRSRTASENKPTDPGLWAKVQAIAKGEQKSMSQGGKTIEAPNDGKGFDIFPSAYANGWASKVYKELGGGWKKKASVVRGASLTEAWGPTLREARGKAKKEAGVYQRLSEAEGVHDVLNTPTPGWLDREFPYVPPPGEADTLYELVQLRSLVHVRDQWAAFIRAADEDLLGLFVAQCRELGVPCGRQGLQRVVGDARVLITKLKWLYNRPRPYQVAEMNGIPFTAMDSKTAHSPAYPSGHTIQSYLLASRLSEVAPQHRRAFMDLAYRISFSRMVAGYHWPSDTMFGRDVFRHLVSPAMPSSVRVARGKAKWASAHEDQLPGGLADKKNPGDFDQNELAKGVKVEMEHVDDKALAREISMDHLTEIPDYYTRLERMESKVALKMAPEFGYQTMVRQDPAQPQSTAPDRTPESVLPLPGSATPGGAGRDIGKFEFNSPSSGADIRPRSLPEGGDERGHPVNDNVSSFSRRTMTASRPEMVWDPEDFEGDPWQLAKAVGVNILSNKDFAAGYAVNGEIVAALFDASSNDEYEFDVAVRKDWQRKGLGAKLMDVALDTFEENREAYGEDYALSLDVISPVAARMLKKRGLVEVGREGGHILMTKRADKAEEGLNGVAARWKQGKASGVLTACAVCVAERWVEARMAPARERGGENGGPQRRQKSQERRKDQKRYKAEPGRKRDSKRWYHTKCKPNPNCRKRRKEHNDNPSYYKRRAPKMAQLRTVPDIEFVIGPNRASDLGILDGGVEPQETDEN